MSRGFLAFAVCVAAVGYCAAAEPIAPPTKIASDHLPNCFRLNQRVISGGEPDGEQAFAELQKLGVKTVLSVDGARPNVEAAKKHGLRYVHLPHGYDGIPNRRLKELAKAVRDLPGPFYVHCHHGKNRSPAAAAAACLALGEIDKSQGLALLKAAGTNESYRGLFQAVESASRLSAAELDELQVEFPEVSAVPPLAEAMVELEHTHDKLKAASTDGWQAAPDDPDSDPAHAARLLKEHFAALATTDAAQAKPPAFQDLLRGSQTNAGELQAALEAAPGDPARRKLLFERVINDCKQCHQKFRDVPLGEQPR